MFERGELTMCEFVNKQRLCVKYRETWRQRGMSEKLKLTVRGMTVVDRYFC
jgi:hypothetical protein